ncbi:MAG: carboxyl transferase domain-containing protein, partial [Akkermansia sp.]
DQGINDVIPDSNKIPLDTYKVIERLVDNNDFMEVQRDFAKNVIIGFARIGGVVVGIIANQPNFKAGCLDIDASDKAARFIRFCNAFNISLVTLVDVPGFLPGIGQERGGIIRHGAKLLFAYSQATVPKITLIMRKAYGGAYIAMCSKDLGADVTLAWPGAEIAVMGAEGAVNVLYGRQLKTAENPEEERAKLLDDYREKFYNPYVAAQMGLVTEVINPSESRAKIAMALRSLLHKKEIRPAKKHGNIPL